MNVQGKNIQISANGITVCFDDFGRGQIPLIFIHGFPFDKSAWLPQLTALKSTHRVIAYDIRGFGATSAGKQKESIRLFADDLIKFLDQMGIPKAVVCGLSMGGYIVLNAVERYPDRFEALILSDTQAIADAPKVKEKRLETIEQIKKEGTTAFTEGFVQKVFCAESLENKKELVENVKKIMLSTPQQTIISTLTALAERPNMSDSLRKIEIPTLIICGKEDTVTPPTESEFLHIHIKNSVLQLIEKAGHLANLEQPDVFNKSITQFMSDIAPQSVMQSEKMLTI